MAKKDNGDGCLLVLGLIVVAGIWFWNKFGTNVTDAWDWGVDNWRMIILTIVALWGISILFRIISYFREEASYKAWLEEKRNRLIDEYGEDTAELIMDGRIWQGQTDKQLVDSWGVADDKDIKILKTKSKEIWKYDKIGKNRYRKIVTIENGLVVGWEKK